MADFKTEYFPKSRIATHDICTIGIKKHYITALIEVDVSGSIDKINQKKEAGRNISFTSWLIKVVGTSIKHHERVAAFLKGKRRVIIFPDINISMVVEKELNGHKIPIPLLIEKVNERSIASIYHQITEAKDHKVTDKDIVLHGRLSRMENFYYYLPAFVRRLVWRFLLSHPHLAYSKMGNVAFTAVGMIGMADGWFIPISVHPICFGIGRIIKKPIVVHDKIEIREMLKVTILFDHDVVDGGEMARFVNDFSEHLEQGAELT